MTYISNIDKIMAEKILLITFSKSRTSGLTKARIRPLDEAGSSYQLEQIINTKAFHKNIKAEDLSEFFMNSMRDEFKNAVIYTKKADYYIRRTKKGELNIMKRPGTKKDLSHLGHDIKKNYIISEGTAVPFLIELEIMNEEGRINKKHYSKFRQINRFLELVQDEDKMWEGRNDIRIYDLCCGKGYLTLALHYYFSNIKGMKTEIEGIDLKEDVIGKLNSIIKKLNLEGIKFVHGDILEAQLESPDMVVALHACDIATDISLAAAVAENTKLIMSVPCCQHELFSQMANEELAPILKYGIMKDKFTELATNALRGLALEASGYNVKMIEFTAVTHTMKNIMIKAVKGKKKSSKALKEYYRFSKSMGVKCSAELILKESKPKIES